MLGLIVRADDTGLGNQTRALCYMLKPDKVLIVNSEPFNKNKQHFEWYDGFDSQVTKGWPTNVEMFNFMKGLTHLVTAETIYNNSAFMWAKRFNTKVFIQPNWEFLDHLRDRIPEPSKWIMPSYWHLEEMESRFNNVVYLPPPLFQQDFKKAREQNFAKTGKRRFLHVVGKAAYKDRNGTKDLLESLKYSKENFDLIIRSQFPLDEYRNFVDDSRVYFENYNFENQSDIYQGFDAIIIPRRYGGLCLPMNEALMSGLPVIMTDISPNNRALPEQWLVKSNLVEVFKTRSDIELYSVNYEELGEKLDWLATIEDDLLLSMKYDAFQMALDNYSSDRLYEKYKKELEL